MEFLSMGWIYAMPAFVAGLVLLYFLKLKRRVVHTSSTFLWHRALNDLRVNSPLQRLRMNLLLLLQLAALILLLLALARPVSDVGGLTGTDSILLIDVSASMQAKDGGGGETRFEKAVAGAKVIVDDLSRSDKAIVIAFADDVRVLTDLTESKTLLHKALDSLEPTDRPTSLAGAIHRVRALLGKANRSPELYVFSDGRVGDLSDVALEEGIPLKYVTVGGAEDNLGIVAVDVTLATGLGEETRALVSVQNSGSKPKTVGVDLFVDGELSDSREVVLNAGGVGSVPFDASLFHEAGRTRRLKVKLDQEDAFPTDDVAWALLDQPEPIRVLLVTGGNLFLHSALSEDPLIWKTPRGDIPLMAVADFDPDSKDLRDYDVIVLDRFTPEQLPPGNYLCFGARPPFPEFEDVGQAEGGKILDWDESHEVARFVNFATLIMPTARAFKIGPRYTTVVRGTLGPVVVDARSGDRRAVVCSFDLMAFPVEGAWTFDPSFPIFLANAIRSLAGGGEARRKGRLVRTGETAELQFPTTAATATVAPPVGEPYDVSILEGDELLRLTELDRIGVYTVTFKDEKQKQLRQTSFSVNLANAAESTIKPAPEIKLLGREAFTGNAQAEETNEDVWKFAALAALLFVVLEWWVYNRRVFI